MSDSKPQFGPCRSVEELELEFMTKDIEEDLQQIKIKKTEDSEVVDLHHGASSDERKYEQSWRFRERSAATVHFPNAATFRNRQSMLASRRGARSSPADKTKLPCFNDDPTMDFPFLHDPQTVKLIKQSKVLFIMRGLSGSGKSVLAKAITDTYDSSVVCCADDYFMRNGQYRFDRYRLKYAHEACQNKANGACNANVATVVVDNTNVQQWEMKFYLEVAVNKNYMVILVEPRTWWKSKPKELAARNEHGVREELLWRKLEQFDDLIPVYYGWFLNESSSKTLSVIACNLLKECAQQFCPFTDMLVKQLQVSSPKHSRFTSVGRASPSTATVRDNLWESYTRKVGCLLHCTAKHCSTFPAHDAKSYHTRSKVQESLGQGSQLKIVSMCFSSRSIDARVQLTKDQLSLFVEHEQRDRSCTQLRGPAGVRGRSAHITIVSGPGSEPMKASTDDMLLRLFGMETEKPVHDADFVPVTGGKAGYFGDGVCCVYFEPPVCVSSIYLGFYKA